MANTHFVVQMQGGLGTLTLKVYTRGTSTIINTGGDTASENGTRAGWYDWTVTEDVSGIQDCVISNASGLILASLQTPIHSADDTGTYVIEELSAARLSSGTGTGQISLSSGAAQADVAKWLGTAASTPTVAGVPNVNVKTWNDLTTVALPLVPTTAGRTLDVSAGGEAGVDWANVGSPTTTVGLSGTTVKTATDVETDTADIQSRLPAALGANGNIKADVRDYSGTAGTFSGGRPEVNMTHIAGTAWASTTLFTLASHDPGETIMGATDPINVTQWNGSAVATPNAAGVPVVDVTRFGGTAGTFSGGIPAVNMRQILGTTLTESVGGYLAAAFTTQYNVASPVFTNESVNLTSTVAGRIDAAISTRSSHSAADVWTSGTRTLTAGTNIQLPSNGLANVTAWTVNITGTLSGNVGGIGTGGITTASFATGAIDATALASDAANEIADAVLSRNVSNTEASAAEHTLCTLVLAGMESSISGTTWTIKRTNGSTTHYTKTVSKTAGDDPIRGVS